MPKKSFFIIEKIKKCRNCPALQTVMLLLSIIYDLEPLGRQACHPPARGFSPWIPALAKTTSYFSPPLPDGFGRGSNIFVSNFLPPLPPPENFFVEANLCSVGFTSQTLHKEVERFKFMSFLCICHCEHH